MFSVTEMYCYPSVNCSDIKWEFEYVRAQTVIYAILSLQTIFVTSDRVEYIFDMQPAKILPDITIRNAKNA